MKISFSICPQFSHHLCSLLLFNKVRLKKYVKVRISFIKLNKQYLGYFLSSSAIYEKYKTYLGMKEL